jgi:competence protein ComEC
VALLASSGPPSTPPAAGLAVALLIGTAAGVTLQVEDVPAWTWMVAALPVVTLVAVAWRRFAQGLVVAAGGLGLAAGLVLGARAARAALAPELAVLADGEAAVIEGVLRDDAVPGDFGVSCTLDVDRAGRRAAWTPAAGGVRLTINGVEAPAAREAWRAGRRLRVSATLRRPLAYRNFGTPDQEVRIAWRGVRLFGTVKSAALVEVVSRGSWFAEAAAAARAWTRRTVADAIGPADPQAAAVVLAVLIGDRAGLAADVEARLQRAGTYHVLAISGGNIAVLAALVLGAVGRVGLAPRPRAIAVLVVLAAYATAIVGGPSVARATLAAAVYLSARALDLRTPALNAVAVTVVLLVAATPLAVVDVAFWLTVLASLAILTQAEGFARAIERPILPRMPPWSVPIVHGGSLLVGATIAAEGTVGPITAYAFGQATLAGLLLNFVAVPLMSVVQCAGFAIIAAAAVHPLVATVPAAVARLSANGIVWSAGLVDVMPWTAWQVAPPPLWIVAIAVGAWTLLWHRGARVRVRRAAAAIWLAAVLAIGSGRAPALPAPADALRRDRPCDAPDLPADRPWLRVLVLDVGQGDAAAIRFPGGSTWLVDAGGTQTGSRFDVGSRVVAPALRAQGVRALDALILSHPDVDHAGGAAGLIPLVPPSRVFEGVPVTGLAVLDAVRRAAADAGASWGTLTAGADLAVEGAVVRVLHPPEPDWIRRTPRNDDSVVLEVRLRDVAIVLPGDAGAAVEPAIAAALAPARLRVLEAGHHGSRTSSSAAFLEAVNPAVVVASAGRANRYGHPHPSVIARVEARGVPFYRTDRDGAVAIDTDGRWLRVTACDGATTWRDAVHAR